MQTLLDLFQTFESSPREAMALVFPKQRSSFSYAELYGHSLRLAARLKHEGVAKGDKVALWMPGSPLAVVSFWAILCRGAVLVPISAGLKDKEAEKRILDTECKFILGGPLKKADFSIFKKVRSMSFFDLPEIIEKSKPIKAENVKPNDLAQILFTSGTSGEAKGVCLSHKNLMVNVQMRAAQLPSPKAGERSLCLVDFSHGFGQTAGFLVPFLLGGSAVFLPKVDLKNVVSAWATENFSAVMLTPVYLRTIKNYLEKMPAKYREPLLKRFVDNFKFFVCVGTALDSQTREFWENLQMPILEGYGMTECFPISISTPSHRQEGTLGRSVPGISVNIANGEILLKGDNVFKGYWKKPKDTKAAFTKDGWFKTGDLGETDNGYIKVFGRREEAIVSEDGEKIFPSSVENIINGIDGVRESCVVGKKGGKGQSLHAVLILTSKDIDAKTVIANANKKLPKTSQVKSFSSSPADEFPKTSTGKIQRFRVAEYAVNHNLSQT